MTPKVYINGKLFDKADAKISVYDHGLLYGDGVFEGIRVYDGKVFRLKEHVDRLYDSARAIKLEIPMSQRADDRGDPRHREGQRQARTATSAWWSRAGAGYLGLDPRKTTDPQVIIIVDDISLYPPELYENGMEIATAVDDPQSPQRPQSAHQVAATTSTTSWPRSRASRPAASRRSCSTTRARWPSAPATTSSSSSAAC